MRIIDLSHRIEEHMPVFPGTPSPDIHDLCSIERDGFLERLVSFSSHTGTHIDVPAHLMSDGRTIDSYPVNSFYGPAIKVDCRNIRSITKSMIQHKIQNAATIEFILLFTGWDEYWGSDRYHLEFPVLEHAAADYIASLPIKGVGIDAVSFDPHNDKELFNHHALMYNEIILIENLCNLKAVPENDFILSCMPLNIIGLDGCPVRAFGLLK